MLVVNKSLRVIYLDKKVLVPAEKGQEENLAVEVDEKTFTKRIKQLFNDGDLVEFKPQKIVKTESKKDK